MRMPWVKMRRASFPPYTAGPTIPVAEGIYYVQSVDQQNEHVFEIRFLDFTPAATTVVNRFESRRGIGLSVSNDRETILFSGESLEHGNDLVLFENFR